MEQNYFLDEDKLIEMTELFKVFGDSTRIKIRASPSKERNAFRRSPTPPAQASRQ